MSEQVKKGLPCPLSTGFVGVMSGYVEKTFVLANAILKILEANKGKIFSAEELARELPKEHSLEEIRDAMWLLDQQGKAKLWVRLP